MEVEEGMSLELALQLPPCWPLKPVSIDPRRKVHPRTHPCAVPVLARPLRGLVQRPLPQGCLPPPWQGIPYSLVSNLSLPGEGGCLWEPAWSCSTEALAARKDTCQRQRSPGSMLVQVGVSEGRLRKWLLSITVLLRAQNGGILPALALWRRNCAKEFAGVLLRVSMCILQEATAPVCPHQKWLLGMLSDGFLG